MLGRGMIDNSGRLLSIKSHTQLYQIVLEVFKHGMVSLFQMTSLVSWIEFFA